MRFGQPPRNARLRKRRRRHADATIAGRDNDERAVCTRACERCRKVLPDQAVTRPVQALTCEAELESRRRRPAPLQACCPDVSEAARSQSTLEARLLQICGEVAIWRHRVCAREERSQLAQACAQFDDRLRYCMQAQCSTARLAR